MEQTLRVYKQSRWRLFLSNKTEYELSQKQVDFLLAHESDRFIVFGSIVINPAFVVLIEKISSDRELTEEERRLSEKFT